MTKQHCTDTLDLDPEANWIVCDLEAGHHGDHHATGNEYDTGTPRTYEITWNQAPDVVPGEVIPPLHRVCSCTDAAHRADQCPRR